MKLWFYRDLKQQIQGRGYPIATKSIQERSYGLKKARGKRRRKDRDPMQIYALLYGGGPDADGIDRTLAHFIPEVFKAMKLRLVQ